MLDKDVIFLRVLTTYLTSDIKIL